MTRWNYNRQDERTTRQLLSEVSSAATPPSGCSAIYAKTNGKVYSKDDAGTETLLTAVGVVEQWIPAAAMVSRTTNGPSAGTVETTTNKVMLQSLDFDATTQEFAQFKIAPPKRWNGGTVTAMFYWSHPSTTTDFGVVFALQGVALSNDDALDSAFSLVSLSLDTGGTTDDVYVSPATSAHTIAGTPADGDMIVFQVSRVPSNVSDTMAVDARLHGVKLFWTVDATTDD